MQFLSRCRESDGTAPETELPPLVVIMSSGRQAPLPNSNVEEKGPRPLEQPGPKGDGQP